ncbi:hypothetical protein GS458_1814 [Geobacillus stearothermophilus]|nr:hypothetical protein GS458_1814 [Geobacillus stearothermophilus]
MVSDKENDYSLDSLAKRFFKENKEEILKYIQLLITLFIVWYSALTCLYTDNSTTS